MLVKWVAFSVGLPFVPFFLSVMKYLLIVSPVPTPPMDLLHLMIFRGTLLALAGGLAVGAMGELVANTREWGAPKYGP